MDRPYRHFTLEERRTLFRLLNAKLPIKEIAGQLGRHRSTIYREIARNEFREVKQYRGYYAVAVGSASSSGIHACAVISLRN
jgi:IS30 family transposase